MPPSRPHSRLFTLCPISGEGAVPFPSHLLYIQSIKLCPLYFKMRSVSTRGLTALPPQLLHGNPFRQVQRLRCTACMYDHLFNGFLLPLGQNHNSVPICLSPKTVRSLGEGTVVQFIIKYSLNEIYWMDEWECLHWLYSMAKPKSFFSSKVGGRRVEWESNQGGWSLSLLTQIFQMRRKEINTQLAVF